MKIELFEELDFPIVELASALCLAGCPVWYLLSLIPKYLDYSENELCNRLYIQISSYTLVKAVFTLSWCQAYEYKSFNITRLI